MKNKPKNYVFSELVISIFSIFSMLLLGYNTSPLINRIGEDSGIYLLIGKYLLRGSKLYIDFFDHKGPLIFLINSIPQIFINGGLGVWIIEVIAMIVSAILVYKISYWFTENNISIVIASIYVILSCYLFQGGNYSEEYANLFNIICIYILAKWKLNNQKDLKRSQSILLGICIAFNFFMKPNVALFSIFIWIYLLVQIIINNKKSLLRYIKYTVVGAAIIVVPVMIFAILQNNLLEMFNAMIIHNIKYCESGNNISFSNTASIFQNIVLCSIIISLVAISKLFSNIKIIDGCFIIVLQVLSIINVLLGGKGFYYYLLMELPTWIICALIIINKIKFKKIFNGKIFISIVLLLSGVIVYYQAYNIRDINNIKLVSSEYKEDAKKMGDLIKKDKEVSVFGYDAPAMWFLENDIKPPIRYFTMQEWMAKSDPRIYDEVNDYVINEKPKWIVIYKEDIDNKVLKKELISNYKKVESNSAGILFKRINRGK